MWILASTCAVSGCKNFIEQFRTLTARENSAWDLQSGCESSWQHSQHGMVNDLWKENMELTELTACHVKLCLFS